MNELKVSKHSPKFAFWNEEATINLIIAGVALCGIVISFLRTGITAAIFYSFFFVFYAFLTARTLKALKELYQPQSSLFLLRHPIVFSIVLALLGGIVLEFLTLIGAPASSPAVIGDWGKKRLIIFAMLTFPVAPYIFRLTQRLNRTNCPVQQIRAHRTLTPSIPFLAFVIPVILGVTALVCGVTIWHTSAVLQRALFLLLCIFLGLFLLLWIKRSLYGQPELAFLIIALASTSFLSFSLPTVTGTSWDAQIHFDRSLGLSYLTSGQYGEAEAMLVNLPSEQFSDPDKAVQDLSESYDAEKTDKAILTRTGLFAPVSGESLLTITTIGYIPSALGLWIGRLLGLPINGIVILGRLANAISYCVVMTYAIRVIPNKKYLLLAIGLLPTSLFLAANYSYDPWVISFLSLGIAMILRERASEPKMPISKNRILGISLVLFLGLCPKAIYFPVIALMYLIPSSRFSSKRSYHKFCRAVFLFGCIMFSSFILPMIFSTSVQAGDIRGGENVNSLDQIKYILTHPVDYLLVEAKFMSSYMLTNSAGYSLSYAYMGSLATYVPQLINLPLFWLLAVSAVDNSEQPKFTLVQSVLLVLLTIFIVFLVSSSLYVSFTPVGYETVNGCQPRYLLPILLVPLSIINIKHLGGVAKRSDMLIFLVGSIAIIACNLLVVLGTPFQ